MSDEVHTEGAITDALKKELSKQTGLVSKEKFEQLRKEKEQVKKNLESMENECNTLKATTETMQEAINKMFQAVIQNVNSKSMTYDEMEDKMRFHVNDLTSSVKMLREQVLEQEERQKQLIEDHKKQLDKLSKQFLEATKNAAAGWVQAREGLEKKIKELKDNHAQIVPQPDNHASPENRTNPFIVESLNNTLV